MHPDSSPGTLNPPQFLSNCLKVALLVCGHSTLKVHAHSHLKVHISLVCPCWHAFTAGLLVQQVSHPCRLWGEFSCPPRGESGEVKAWKQSWEEKYHEGLEKHPMAITAHLRSSSLHHGRHGSRLLAPEHVQFPVPWDACAESWLSLWCLWKVGDW